ncbi:MAG: hypothetical protein JSS79_08235 [Bacteroidetes bacterium]|nr:hypothetical protein [Bacteroidota bacterium]
MNEQFLTFRKFNTVEEAQELADLLKANNIGSELEDTAGFDVSFSGNPLNKEFRVKLLPADFERAEKLLLHQPHVTAEQLAPDHYLLSFSDDELLEIVTKPDEWSATDYQLALQLLKAHGKEMSADRLSALKKQRYHHLAQPEETKPVWIFVGFLSALLGGVLGIFIGWHLMAHKKTLPDGQRVYGYTTADRKKGQTIFFLGLIFGVLWLLVLLSDLE